jgi:PPOX class probable F420-dependent enzyme
MMTPDEEQFVKEHRLCVVSTLRQDGAPQSTPVYYLYEGGKLYISVTKSRKKTVNVARDARVSVVVLAEDSPFRHVQVQGTAVVSDDDLVETSRRIWSTFRDELPEDFAQVMRDQGRTLMVVTPVSVTSNLAARR